jgi:hypothetical protein
MNKTHNENRCKARTKAGKPCRAAASDGGLCFLHANPNKAAELGRMGGLKNRHVVAGAAVAAVPALDSALAVRNAIAQVFTDLYSGRISPKVASSLAALLSLEVRAIGIWDLVQEIEMLKKGMAEAKAARSDNERDRVPEGKARAEDEPEDPTKPG